MAAKPDLRTADERAMLETFLEQYRQSLPRSLDGLDEEQARRRLVPSRTTLLGLVKHLTFVEGVWFHEAITGTPRSELGPATPDASFVLGPDDTVASVREAHERICAGSRQRAADLSLDHVLTDPRSRSLTVRFLYLQCLKEYAQHSGHADILREQILAE